MKTIISVLEKEKGKWVVWNPFKMLILHIFNSLDSAWDAVEKIGGNLDVIKSEELLEKIKNVD